MVTDNLNKDPELQELFRDFDIDPPEDDDADPRSLRGSNRFSGLLPSTTDVMNTGPTPRIFDDVPPSQVTYPQSGSGIPHEAIGLEEKNNLQPPQETDDTAMTPTPKPPSTEQPQRPPYLKNFERLRVSRQETLPFTKPTEYGPICDPRLRTTPYSKTNDEEINVTIDAEITSRTKLPPGWKVENGHIILDEVTDDWVIKDNYLVCRHYTPKESVCANG